MFGLAGDGAVPPHHFVAEADQFLALGPRARADHGAADGDRFTGAQFLEITGEQADRAPGAAGNETVQQARRRVAEALAIKSDVHVAEDVAFPGLDVAAIGLDQALSHARLSLGSESTPGRPSGRRLWQTGSPAGKHGNQGETVSGMSFL